MPLEQYRKYIRLESFLVLDQAESHLKSECMPTQNVRVVVRERG